MAKFNTFIYDSEIVFNGAFGGEFPIDSLDRVPWVFKDIAGDDEYEFAVNPVDASFPVVEKRITTQYTASGRPVNFEGRSAAGYLSFSGTILYQEHYEIMLDWLDKSTQISVTDDLGRNFWIFLTEFSPTRTYHAAFPWRHEYNASGLLISWG